jgi:hypothetical protein
MLLVVGGLVALYAVIGLLIRWENSKQSDIQPRRNSIENSKTR